MNQVYKNIVLFNFKLSFYGRNRRVLNTSSSLLCFHGLIIVLLNKYRVSDVVARESFLGGVALPIELVEPIIYLIIFSILLNFHHGIVQFWGVLILSIPWLEILKVAALRFTFNPNSFRFGLKSILSVYLTKTVSLLLGVKHISLLVINKYFNLKQYQKYNNHWVTFLRPFLN